MKSCDENQNLMSTLLPLKIVRVPRITASKISIPQVIRLWQLAPIAYKKLTV